MLKGAALAAAAVAGSGSLAGLRTFDLEAAAAPAHHGVFGYGVASGDPTGDAIVLWTRATPPPETPGGPVATPGSGLGPPLRVRWELAYDRHFRHVVKRGTVSARAASDHTVKVDVHGLRPYTRYWYRFRAAGETSPVGRTQTAPDDPRREHALRFALVSCSNYTGGYFTAYRALGERDDLDFVLHVGDYVYEYGNGPDRYGPADLVGKRDGIPATETVDLEGYRLRHALHKADPDLQLAHARHPWITIFDDHEVANNAWRSGAENHTPGRRGRLPRAAAAGVRGLPGVDALPAAVAAHGRPPGHAVLQAVHLRPAGRPVGAGDAAEPQRPGRRRPVHEDRRRLHPHRGAGGRRRSSPTPTGTCPSRSSCAGSRRPSPGRAGPGTSSATR